MTARDHASMRPPRSLYCLGAGRRLLLAALLAALMWAAVFAALG